MEEKQVFQNEVYANCKKRVRHMIGVSMENYYHRYYEIARDQYFKALGFFNGCQYVIAIPGVSFQDIVAEEAPIRNVDSEDFIVTMEAEGDSERAVRAREWGY